MDFERIPKWTKTALTAGSLVILTYIASDSRINFTKYTGFPSRIRTYDFDRHYRKRNATSKGEFKVIPIPTQMKPDKRVTRASLPDTTDYRAF